MTTKQESRPLGPPSRYKARWRFAETLAEEIVLSIRNGNLSSELDDIEQIEEPLRSAVVALVVAHLTNVASIEADVSVFPDDASRFLDGLLDRWADPK